MKIASGRGKKNRCQGIGSVCEENFLILDFLQLGKELNFHTFSLFSLKKPLNFYFFK